MTERLSQLVYDFPYPVIVKPVRGRGSEGAPLINGFVGMLDAVASFDTVFSVLNAHDHPFIMFGKYALMWMRVPFTPECTYGLPSQSPIANLVVLDNQYLHASSSTSIYTLSRSPNWRVTRGQRILHARNRFGIPPGGALVCPEIDEVR